MDKAIAAGRNVIDLFGLRRRDSARPRYPYTASANYCSHCGGWMAEGETEEDCSSMLRAKAARTAS
jgi:hypothetical protein